MDNTKFFTKNKFNSFTKKKKRVKKAQAGNTFDGNGRCLFLNSRGKLCGKAYCTTKHRRSGADTVSTESTKKSRGKKKKKEVPPKNPPGGNFSADDLLLGWKNPPVQRESGNADSSTTPVTRKAKPLHTDKKRKRQESGNKGKEETERSRSASPVKKTPSLDKASGKKGSTRKDLHEGKRMRTPQSTPLATHQPPSLASGLPNVPMTGIQNLLFQMLLNSFNTVVQPNPIFSFNPQTFNAGQSDSFSAPFSAQFGKIISNTSSEGNNAPGDLDGDSLILAVYNTYKAFKGKDDEESFKFKILAFAPEDVDDRFWNTVKRGLQLEIEGISKLRGVYRNWRNNEKKKNNKKGILIPQQSQEYKEILPENEGKFKFPAKKNEENKKKTVETNYFLTFSLFFFVKKPFFPLLQTEAAKLLSHGKL